MVVAKSQTRGLNEYYRAVCSVDIGSSVREDKERGMKPHGQVPGKLSREAEMCLALSRFSLAASLTQDQFSGDKMISYPALADEKVIIISIPA